MNHARNLNHTSPADLRVLVEAFTLLIAARVIQRFVPFRVIARWGSHPDPASIILKPAQHAAAERINRAIYRIQTRIRPLDGCLPLSIAALIMLRVRAIPGTLHIGVHTFREGEDFSLGGHAWVEAGEVVIGARTNKVREIYKGEPVQS